MYVKIHQCNDSNSNMPNNDTDCDGVLTADDCNDNDATIPSNDADCDGVLTADDCNDSNPLDTDSDGDCDDDGILAADDCNDNDATSTTVSNDPDCDGIINASIADIQTGVIVNGQTVTLEDVVISSPLNLRFCRMVCYIIIIIYIFYHRFVFVSSK